MEYNEIAGNIETEVLTLIKLLDNMSRYKSKSLFFSGNDVEPYIQAKVLLEKVFNTANDASQHNEVNQGERACL